MEVRATGVKVVLRTLLIGISNRGEGKEDKMDFVRSVQTVDRGGKGILTSSHWKDNGLLYQ